MARGLTSGTLAELPKQRVFPVIFCELDFADGNVFVWSGIGSKTWNSITWQGIGSLGSISAIEEGGDVQARGITLSLSGVPQSMLNEALGQCRPGNPVKLWFGFLDSTGAVIVDPFQSFSGKMDVPTIDEGSETATISLTVESRLIDLQRTRERYYSHEDQQRDFPGDKGFEYVPSLQEINIVWGKGDGIPVSTGRGGVSRACFSGNTRVKTAHGPIAFEDLLPDDEFLTEFGYRRASILVHNFKGELLDMGNGELVTADHLIKFDENDWRGAAQRWDKRVPFEGKVYNLHIATEKPQERHFLLANGITAHNMKVNEE